MGFCHENQGLSALCVAWSRAPRALDGEMPGTGTKGPPLLDPTPAALPQAGGLQELLAQGRSGPSAGWCLPGQGSLLSGFPNLRTQTGKPLPMAKGKLPRSSTRSLAIVKVLTLSKYIYVCVCMCVCTHTHARTSISRYTRNMHILL